METTQEWGDTCSNEDDPFRLENWIHLFSDYTPVSLSIPLTLSEAVILKKYYEYLRNYLQYDGFQKRQKNPDHMIGSDWDSKLFDLLEAKVKIEEEHKNVIENLENRLDEVISKFPHGAFVKLSTRSPKDAGIWTADIKKIFNEEMKKLVSSQNNVITPEMMKVNHMIAYIRTKSYSLRVNSGKEAVKLLLRSKRIFTDLSFALLRCGNESDKFNLKLIIREWNPLILPELEMRCFIWEHKLTASVIYSSDCYVPMLAENQEKVKKLIQTFINQQILPKISENVPNLTVDIAINYDLDRVFLVELGNPPPVAGTSLLVWEKDVDKDIITGKSPNGFELVILKEWDENNWKDLHSYFKKIINEGEFSLDEDKVTKKNNNFSLNWAPIVMVLVAVSVGCYYYLNVKNNSQ